MPWPTEVYLVESIETTLVEFLFQEYDADIVPFITNAIADVVGNDHSRRPKQPKPFRNDRPKRRAYLHNEALSRLGYSYD